jgi:hypothetical protein
MEELVDWELVRETEVLEEEHFVYHESNITLPGMEPGLPRW